MAVVTLSQYAREKTAQTRGRDNGWVITTVNRSSADGWWQCTKIHGIAIFVHSMDVRWVL